MGNIFVEQGAGFREIKAKAFEVWVGEGDLPTPPFISEAAKASLDRGETFYTWQNGVPELREAIAAYMTRVYGAAPGGRPFSPQNFFVTIGGMHAIEIATRLIVGPGDEEAGFPADAP